MMNLVDRLSLLRAIVICLLLHWGNPISGAHEGGRRPSQGTAKRQASTSDAEGYRRVFAALISQWPTPLQQELISHSWKEHQHIEQMPSALSDAELRSDRAFLLKELEDLIPSMHVDWNESSATLRQSSKPVTLCRSITSPLLVTVHNQTSSDQMLAVAPKTPFGTVSPAPKVVRVRSGSKMIFLTSVLVGTDLRTQGLTLGIGDSSGQSRPLVVPVQISEPAKIVGTVREDGKPTPARVTVVCSDGVCRYGGEFVNKSTFTDKPIIYPPIGGWQKTSFFYSDGSFDLKVPPGKTQVSVERGFEYHRTTTSLNATSEKVHSADFNCKPMIDLAGLGWVSGDTHVHWVTNGSDHPARTLGIARAYVKVDGDFSYDRWIEGIRRGRTFTSSGPLIYLKVNESDIGDVITAAPNDSLKITASVLSRDSIGRFEIVSNGQVIANKQTDDTRAELTVTIPAGGSRWIVTRCSNRTDGRADFGFGNFNAITGKGVAHTSPVYVEVDGRPRFDADAAAYWQDEYYYERPFELPAGTELRVDAAFDNSEQNVLNPSSPPKRVPEERSHRNSTSRWC